MSCNNTKKEKSISKQQSVPLNFRSPTIVMDPERLGTMHQSRLSFARRLVRRMAQNKWNVKITKWDLSDAGLGSVCYTLTTKLSEYHLVIFSQDIKDEERNDRVIATKWDVTFAFIKGNLTTEIYDWLEKNVPKQEAGRNFPNVLVLGRANKSVRVFNNLVEKLAQGEQPEIALLREVGYILRTTAVYGNGKFGILDFDFLRDNSDFNLAFGAQMCAVYLLRQFSVDWIHYIAKSLNPSKFTPLNRQYQRYLGIGNATGLGMAPYLINHPRIINQWLTEKEHALAMISNIPIDPKTKKVVLNLLQRAREHLLEITTIDLHQESKNQQAILELPQIITTVQSAQNSCCWKYIIEKSSCLTYETQEIVIACLLEIFPEVSDQFSMNMKLVDQTLSLDNGITIYMLQRIIETKYDWALKINFSQPDSNYWFWYISEDKEEPRLGIRGQDHGENKELPLDIARQVSTLHNMLQKENPHDFVSEFLLLHPQFSMIARRVWTMGHEKMGDIEINILDKNMLPIHLLRCKLSFLGATKFDPRSDRWVRVTFFQGAPLIDELHTNEWLFPTLNDTTI